MDNNYLESRPRYYFIDQEVKVNNKWVSLHAKRIHRLRRHYNQMFGKDGIKRMDRFMQSVGKYLLQGQELAKMIELNHIEILEEAYVTTKTTDN